MMKTIPASLQALLTDLVDYAGLFPPAALGMEAAARAYAGHRLSARAFMLGRFVVPATRLSELARSIERLDRAAAPWPLSVLTGTDPEGARAAVREFESEHADLGRAVAVEMRASDEADVESGASLFPEVERFFEIRHDRDPAHLMQAIARTDSRAKIRSGGVTSEAFPSAAEVARFLVAAAHAGIAFKATAGLHHPLCGTYRLTYDEDSPGGRMFGFLGVFLAAVWVHSGATDANRLSALLEEQDAASFSFNQAAAWWRGVRFQRADIESARSSFARSYGSCSFDEPTGDLETLGLLEPV